MVILEFDLNDPETAVVKLMIEQIKGSLELPLAAAKALGVCPHCCFTQALGTLFGTQLVNHHIEENQTDESFTEHHTKEFVAMLGDMLKASRDKNAEPSTPAPTHPGTRSTN